MQNFYESKIQQILGPFITDLDGNFQELLDSFGATLELISSIPEEHLDFRYEPTKWSIKELFVHMIDTTQILGYRLLTLARGEKSTLPVADENLWAQNVDYAKIDREYLAEGYAYATNLILWQMRTFKPNNDQHIVCNGIKIHFEEMLKYIVGHERLHRQSLKDKYLSLLDNE